VRLITGCDCDVCTTTYDGMVAEFDRGQNAEDATYRHPGVSGLIFVSLLSVSF